MRDNMASFLNNSRDYKYIAEKYSEANEFQVNQGKKFVMLLGVRRGDKVVDVGCGTGEITSFITDHVGGEGEVLGIDPDQERIKVAVRKHCEAERNINFMVGDSSSHFPHYNEDYYDVHYSNFVFHWLTSQAKDMYVKAAFNCLKPGGRVTILFTTKRPQVLTQIQELLPDDETEENIALPNYVEKSVAQSMLEKCGFRILFSEHTKEDFAFSSLDTFLTWCCATDYMDESKIVPRKKEAFAKKFVNEDGTVTLEVDVCRIIARK